MNCGDCLHYGICRLDVNFAHADNGEIYQYQDSQKVEKDCRAFLDKSEWVHLPCRVGDTVYVLSDNDYDELKVSHILIEQDGIPRAHAEEQARRRGEEMSRIF